MTTNKRIIRGAGGPGDQGKKPKFTPDNMHSRQFATIQDLLSEGEIEGSATASKAELTKGTTAYNNAFLKDVFLNDTPVLQESADNSSPADTDFNFKNVTFNSRFGTSNQEFIPGITTAPRTPNGVGVVVTVAAPVIRQITTTNLTAVIVTLTWPALQFFRDGDILGDTVKYKIQVQHDSGGFTTKIEDEVSGRSADAYARDHRVELTAGYTTVDIKVVRVTADSTDSNRVNAFQFTSFQEVLDNQSTYPNTAYTSLRLDSKQFSNIPTRKFRLRGIKVKIPGAGANNSGTPTVDVATGRIIYPEGYIFNGVLGAATYTNCPAMCLLDLLTNTRYGFGDHITESNLDLFSFVAASKYANELVDDGSGSGATEARFSCNVNIQNSQEAFDVINSLAGVMRCMPIWSAGSIMISQDKPTTASYLFNLANVGAGGFSYSGSSLRQRHSIVSVSYFNMDSKEVDFEVVEDATAISKLGHVKKTIKAFACTSRGQAARLGRAILFGEQNESETVSFTTSIDSGIVIRPGSVIEVNDPVRAGARRGGRVVSATTSSITIDANASTTLTTLGTDGNPNSGIGLDDAPIISVLLPDGTVESRTITANSSGVLTLNSALSSAPNANSPYVISSNALQTQLFRVIQVEERNEFDYAITALTHVEGKYDFIETGAPFAVRTVSLLNQPAPPPSALNITEQIVAINNIAHSKLIVDWKPVDGVSKYQVNYKFENGNFVTQEVYASDFELMDTPIGEYTFQVFSYNAALSLSANPAVGTFNAVGKTAIPSDVQNLTIEPVNEQFVRLRFSQSTDLDVLHGGRVYVRHSNQTGVNATFQASQDVIEAVAGNATEVIVPALAGTYLLKFQDDGDRFSANAAKVSLSTVQILDSIVLKTDREDTDSTPFSGAKSNTVYDSTKGGLILSNITISSPATKATGTYDFADTLDLGGVFSLSLKRHFQGAGYYPSALFDSRTGLVDTWADWDGDAPENTNAKLAVRTSTDMSSYSDFNDISNGTFKGRGFQFRATLETTDPAQNMLLQQLGYTAEMSSRTEQSGVIASGAGAKTVTFAAPFFVGTSALGNLNNFLPAVAVSPQNMASGDYFELSGVSGTQFTVHFKNSSNASIDRNFTYSAVGFGKGG